MMLPRRRVGLPAAATHTHVIQSNLSPWQNDNMMQQLPLLSPLGDAIFLLTFYKKNINGHRFKDYMGAHITRPQEKLL
ncbi:MAG: hypothetical protein MI749_10875 [Desulfovibrionales bacterium]|nr:hypothetical protein [Desulfovibrionales bacterium]